MRSLRLVLFALLLLLSACAGSHAGDDPAEVAKTTLVHAGDAAPDFTLPTMDRGGFTLSDHRGKVVLVNFFATWCPPCQAEMPHLKDRILKRFGGGDFVLVSVAREEGADVVAPFMKKYGADWEFALDEKRAAFAKYASPTSPATSSSTGTARSSSRARASRRRSSRRWSRSSPGRWKTHTGASRSAPPRPRDDQVRQGY